MKSTWAGLGWLALAACLPLRAGAADDGRPAFEARLVEEELALAKTQSYYFLLDLGAKRLDLRVSGSPLRSWDLARVRVWGEPAALTATALVKKTAIRPPERTVIKPGGEEEPAPAPPPPAKNGTAGETPAPAFELEALELKDMPPVFRMSFDDGFDVSIVTGDQGFKGRAGKLWNEIRWSVGMPLLSLRAKLRQAGLSQDRDHLEGQARRAGPVLGLL